MSTVAASMTYKVSRAGLGLLLLDGRRRVVGVSPEVPALLGLPADALLGQDILALHPPDLRPRVAAMLDAPGETPAARAVTVALPGRTLVLKVEPLAASEGAGWLALAVIDPAALSSLEVELQRPAVARVPVDAPDGVVLLEPREVRVIQAEGHYSRVWTAEGNHFCSLPLKTVEERLSGHGFLRVHRAWVVNLAQAVALRRTRTGQELEVGPLPAMRVPVGRAQVGALRMALGL